MNIPIGRTAPIEKIEGDTGRIAWESDDVLVWDAPVGDRALFAFPLPNGAKFEEYGLCKFEVRIEGGPAEVLVYAERPGERRRIWRPIDIHRPPDGWYTVHVDLAQPEIVRESVHAASAPRLAFHLWSFDSGYPGMTKSRKISIRNVRLVPRYLGIRWNGTDCGHVSGASGGFGYSYPVVVRNLGRVTRTIAARLEREEGWYGAGAISPREATVAPGDSAHFTVTLTFPGSASTSLPVFSCEWFLPVFSLKGVADSDEGILRSCKRIPLPLMVMPEKLGADALFGEGIVGRLRERYAGTDWGKKEGDTLITQAKALVEGDTRVPDGPGWAAAYYYCHEHRCPLRYQGPDKHFCPTGGEYRDVDFEGVDLDRDYRTNIHERLARGTKTLALATILTGNREYAATALGIMDQYREKYFTWDWMDLDTSTDTIDKGRIQFAKYMESYPFRAMVEALTLLRAAGMADDARALRLERELLLPAVAEIADFRMDMICRQGTITLTALEAGLAFGNAPLAAFAVASPFGYWSLRRYGATADGLGHGHGYAQNHFAESLFQMAELMHRGGRDTFDPELKRLADCSFWWSSPMNPGAVPGLLAIAARHYPDPVYRAYARGGLVEGEPPAASGEAPDFSMPPSVNFPNSGLTILRRPDPAGKGTLDAEFKWGIPDNRGSFSVLSFDLNFRGYRAQSYPGHFPWGSTDLHHAWQIQSASHTTLVVDGRNQSGMHDYYKGHYQPHASELVHFEEGAGVSAALARNSRIYPGVDIWRAVCVLDGAYLVMDILRSEAEHTYDWWFHGVPDHSDGLAGIRADLHTRPEPLGTVDGYQMVNNLASAMIPGDLSADWTIPPSGDRDAFILSLRALSTAPLEAVHGYEWSYQYRKPEKEFLVLRRNKARNADFIVLLQPRERTEAHAAAERFAVVDLRDRAVESAAGVRVLLGGKRYEIIVNPDGTEVKAGNGGTREPLHIRVEPAAR